MEPARHDPPSRAGDDTPSRAGHDTPSRAGHDTPSRAGHDTAAPRRDPRGFRVGAVLGIPVFVSGWWLLLVGWVVLWYGGVLSESLPGLRAGSAYLVAAVFAVLLFGSVFLHELGHAVTALRLGIGVRSMSLWLLGGSTEMAREAPTPGREFAIAVAGPAVNLVLGAVGVAAVLVLPSGTVTEEVAIQLAFSNLLVGIFNLLPGLPMDGGRLLRAGVWKVTGDRFAGLTVAGWAGRVLAVGLAVAVLVALQQGLTGFGLSVALMFAAALFLWQGASQAIRSGRLSRRFALLDSTALARPALLVNPDLPLAEALRRAAETGQASLVVVDRDLRPVAVVSRDAVDAVPAERRPWVPVSAVARTLHAGLVLPAGLRGEDVVRAVQASPATEYVVVDGDPHTGGRVVGVLPAAAIADTLEPRKSTR
jgi:Zn-dependent protease